MWSRPIVDRQHPGPHAINVAAKNAVDGAAKHDAGRHKPAATELFVHRPVPTTRWIGWHYATTATTRHPFSNSTASTGSPAVGSAAATDFATAFSAQPTCLRG